MLADWLVVCLAASLPWSTSLTGIFAGLWLLTVLQTLTREDYRQAFSRPAGYLIIALVGVAALGTLWATVPWHERLDGLDTFVRLLCIPLLFAQFSRSDRAGTVMIGFAISCAVLLAVSWAGYFGLDLSPVLRAGGIPVKDYIAQSAVLTVALLFFVRLSTDKWAAGQRRIPVALALLAALCLLNIFYVATSRTALVVTTSLLLLFGFRQFGWRGAAAMLAAVVILIGAAWPTADFLRTRTVGFVEEVQTFSPEGRATPAGERLEFWRKSLGFMTEAPVLGHGTGSIRAQFKKAAEGQTGMAATIAANPHNQLFAVGIQIGVVGIAILIAMWLSHLALFASRSVAGWMGLAIVLQNIAGSMFNSHLFDFTHAWLYVVGVGVAGGAVLREAARVAHSNSES
ncbi:O-antigen ligase family protein [Undibacter mobilis]|uniref:O-antigen ligase domain-containing protein n=1 Tax=Undibacter mobilis TaxID=2292256 RepID=A0A371B6J0_9BRAD|nr:O-antigen ligase family protein [Undibacter mobilis]RDV03127.1 O-antigen ligase domain-containing protein [Undibacter mobilis]